MNTSTLASHSNKYSLTFVLSHMFLFGLLIGAPNLHAASAILSWNANNEPDLAKYNIYQRTLPSTDYGSEIFSGIPSNPSSPQIIANNLAASTSYGFIATAIDTSGNESAPSTEFILTTASDGGGSGNQAPTVSAGPNQTLTLPSNATLNGTVTDDGLPSSPGSVTTTWSKVSGPGTVTFGNTGAVDTTASFSGTGVYVLRLMADDGALTRNDDLTLTVNPTGGGGGSGGTISNLIPASYVVVPPSPGLQVGGLVYNDRSYTFTSVPASVQGAAYIQTENDDKKSTANPFLSFTVDQPVTVYVAHDQRLSLPVWLTNMGFTDTGENLGTSDVPLDLFAQTFPAGPISLGGNESSGKDGSMYSVIVQATGGGNPSNQAPTVSAGPNQTLTLPSNATLNGTVTDDGLPSSPGSVTTTWSKVSGPGTVTFGNTGTVDTTASFSGAGVYVLRLMADDGALTRSDDLTLTVNAAGPVNQAPTVSAGPNQTLTLPSNATLNGTVTDDGLPSSPGSVTTTWSKVSGPGTVTFGNTGAVDTTASFSGTGVYVLRLMADDGALTRNDDLTLTVNPTGGGGGSGGTISNLIPASYVVVPPSPGLQVGGLVYNDRSYTFTSVPASVQGAAYIQTENDDKKSTANPFLSFTVDQPVTVYVAHDQRLSLPVWLTNMGFTDTGENLGTSDVPLDLFAQTFPAGPISLGGNESSGKDGSMYSVIVQATGGGNPSNQAPTVSAGPNQTLTLPSNATLNGTVTDDGLPSSPGSVTTTWSKVSGPGTVTFGNTGTVDTTASFSGAGVYVLRLMADDGALTRSDDLTLTVNPTGGGGGSGGTISNLIPASYVVVPPSPGLQVGGLVYNDRSYTFTSVPASVQGAAYIQTENDDKKSTANPFLSFTVDQPVTVYVAHDQRLSLPVWLTNMGFTDTGENLGTSDVPLDLFAQTFPAGPISLGGNESSSKDGSMYSVIVQATGSGN